MSLASVREALGAIATPSPEVAGCLLRAMLDGKRPDVAGRGVQYVLEAAHRRLVGQGRREHVASLRGGEGWLTDAYLGWIARPSAPVVERLARDLVERARTALAAVRASEEERELLRQLLPFANTTAAVESLGDAGIVQDVGDGAVGFRMESLFAPAVAHLFVAQPEKLGAALLHNRSALLCAVVRAPGGPGAVAEALRMLDTPALAVALGNLEREAQWLAHVQWDAALVARVVAIWLVTNKAWVRAARTGRKPPRIPLPALWTVFGRVGALPTIEHTRAQMEEVSAALFVPPPAWDDASLSMVLALAAPEAAVCSGTTVWDALPEQTFPPADWVEHLATTAEGLLFLVDPLRSPVAVRLLRKKEVLSLVAGPQELQAWLRLVARLFRDAPESAVALLARIVCHLVDLTQKRIVELATDAAAVQDGGADAPWYDDVRVLLEGVAAATELPEARRHTRAIRAALREAMRNWESLVEAPIQLDAMTMGLMVGHRSGPPALVTLLTLCYAAEDRVRFLRTNDGHLSPFSEACLRAGVPFAESLRLYSEVESGALGARPDAGEPMAAEAGRRGIAARILDTLVEVSSPDEIAQLPGFTHPESGVPPAEDVIARHLDKEGARRYLWRFVSTLDEGGVVWRLLERRCFSLSFEEHAEFVGKGGMKVDSFDESSLIAAISLAPASTLSPARWNTLANAALWARVPDAALHPLLESPAVADAREGLLLEVVHRVLDAERDWTRAWLLARLHDAPATVDRASFAPVWKASGIDPTVLEAWLAEHPDRPRGAGLVRALVLLGREQFAEWLGDAGTRDAALGALAMSEDWAQRLGPELGAGGMIPSGEVLAHLLVQPGGVGFHVLDEAAASWPPDRRRALWEAAARVATPPHRAEVWRRMAGG